MLCNCNNQCSQTLQETSFQVVLISGSDLSFILMNYGDIAVQNIIVQVRHDFYISGTNMLKISS